MGADLASMLGRTWAQLGVAASDAERLTLAAAEAVRSGRSAYIGAELPSPTGPRPFACRLDPVLAAGKLAGIAVRAREKGGQQAEPNGQDMPPEPLALLDVVEGGTWSWEIATGEAVWSSGLCRLFGADPSLRAGSLETFLGFVHPEDRARAVSRVHAAVTGCEPRYEQTFRALRPDGEVRHVLSRARLELGSTGNPARLIGVDIDVTGLRRDEAGDERRHGAAALKESEERFRLAAKAIRAIVYDYDLRTGRVFQSDGLHDVVGVHPEPGGRDAQWWMERIHPEDLPRVVAQSRPLLDGVASHIAIEYRVRHEDGRWINVIDRCFVVRDAQGHAVRRVGVSTDITAQKNAEAALRQSEERFRLVLAHSPVALFTQDRELRHTWVYNALIDRPPDAILGRTEADLLPPDEAAPLQAIKRRVMATGQAERHEVTFARHGGPVVADLYLEPVRDADGAVVGVSGAAIDVTVRQRMEAERARLATIVEQSPDVICSADPEGRLTYLNAAARRAFGIEGEAVPADAAIPAFHPAWATERIMQVGIPAALEHGSWSGETSILAHDGREIPTSQVIVANRDQGGRLLWLSTIIRDISERKEAEARQQLLSRELNHRVKNVLALVHAIANQTAAAHAGDPCLFMAEFRGRLSALSAAHDLLVQNRWRGMGLRALVAAVLSPLQPTNGTRIRLRLEDQPLSPTAAQTLALVLHELATNALKHGALSAPPGTVRLTVRKTLEAERCVLEMLWEESGGPTVQAPRRKGFGMMLLERLLRLQHKGEAELDWRKSGLRCRIRLPLEEIDGSLEAGRAAPGEAACGGEPCSGPGSLPGLPSS